MKVHRKMLSWTNVMRKLRIHPGAVCRQLLTHLEDQPRLSASEQQRIIDAVESAGIPHGLERIHASMSRTILRKLLSSIK
jgi:hypothetical protein